MPSVRKLKPVPELWTIFQKLFRAYGPQHWWPAESPLEVVIGAVLTQNTAWQNVERAMANLKHARLLNLDLLCRTPAGRIVELIRPAGYYNIKARRLLSVLNWLKEQGGFAKLRATPTSRLRAGLLDCYGVGPETADSILLYALNRPVFVLDAYTRRILTRYGLIQGDEPYEELRLWIEESLAPFLKKDPRATVRVFNEFHALFVRLAKTHCRSLPRCPGCPLNSR
ncbi:MAG: endonuclease [candidate division WOR-3 bacterium]|uniref:Endonuclease n=2 Tax=candidate division WOR-3 bacterium TaxID=2052148 RepID=A0A7C1NH93_UNCW3|nr:endonuclease [candidate division WOR-3 bacterium]